MAPNIIEVVGYRLIEGYEVFNRFLFHPDAGPVKTLVLIRELVRAYAT